MPHSSPVLATIDRVNGGEFSPTGALHTALSRQKLHKNAQRPDPNRLKGGLDTWAATVRCDANRVAWVTRQAAKPLTTTLDGVMGTSRPERGSGAGASWPITYFGPLVTSLLGEGAGNLVGGTIGVITSPVGRCLSSNWIKQSVARGGDVGAVVAVTPLFALREAFSLVSVLPKAAFTAPAYAVGALYGAVHGLVVVRRQKHRGNETTMLEMDPIDTIPMDRRFVSEDNCVFEIGELVDNIEANGMWSNPFTHNAFSSADIERIVEHRSEKGKRLRPLANAGSQGAQGMSRQTIDQLRTLARTLATDTNEAQGNPAAAKALANWATYRQSLSTLECAAIDSSPQLLAICFSDHMYEVAAAELCIHAFGNSLLRAVAQLERQSPAYRRRNLIARYFTT